MVAITHPGSFGTVRLVAPHRPSPSTFRRRRLAALGALALVLATLLAVASLAGAAVRGAPGFDAEPVARVSVVVAPGDTVWSIAASMAPGEDPRPIVDAIVGANGGAGLVAGQRLDVTLP
jgi:hypothetical protein